MIDSVQLRTVFIYLFTVLVLLFYYVVSPSTISCCRRRRRQIKFSMAIPPLQKLESPLSCPFGASVVGNIFWFVFSRFSCACIFFSFYIWLRRLIVFVRFHLLLHTHTPHSIRDNGFLFCCAKTSRSLPLLQIALVKFCCVYRTSFHLTFPYCAPKGKKYFSELSEWNAKNYSNKNETKKNK